MATTARPFLVKGRKPLKRGMTGADVFALQRALKAADCRKRKAAHHFGIRCVRNVKKFQRGHNLPVTGRVDETTLKRLARYYDGYGIWLIRKEAKQVRARAATDKVNQSVKTAYFLLAHRNETFYTQDPYLRMRAITDKIRPPRVPRWFDCSSACTWFRWVAGLPDPNGRGYDGYGYTGTMLEHGERVSKPQPGDMTFYRGPDHVVIEVGSGMVISNGSSAGPYHLPRGYRPVYQTRRYKVS
jgi:putative peptidoglycan binding protein